MTSLKSQLEMMSLRVPTMSVDVPKSAVVERGLGRLSPPYGPMTTTPDQPSCVDLHLESFGGHAIGPMLDISEPDPLKAVTAPVDSPCIGVCSTTFDDVCIGCGRTVSEVAQWAVMADDQKELVWQRIVLKGFPRIDKRNPPI